MIDPPRWGWQKGKPLPLSVVWATVPIFAGLVLGFSRAIEPYDYWWALAMGRLIAGGTLPSENIFLYTMPADAAFLNQPWLAQWLMFSVHDLGGPALGIALLGVVCAGFAAIILHAMRRDGSELRAAVVATLVSLSIMAPIAAVRTRMFAILPAVFVASLLFGFRRGNVGRSVWLVIPLTVWWSNVHGSFVVAVAWTWILVGDVVFTRLFQKEAALDWKTPLGLAAGTTLAGMVNPLGLNTYHYVVGLALQSTVSQTVTEWQPPSWDEPTGALFLLALVAGLVMVFRKRGEFTLFEVTAFALTVYLGASASRSLLFPALTLPLLIAPTLRVSRSETGEAMGETTTLAGRVHAITIVGLLVMSLLSAPGLGVDTLDALRGMTRRTEPGIGTLTPRNTSLIQKASDGVLFHDQAIGGQIEFETGRRAAFVDQRMELVPEAVWSEYEVLSNTQPGWRDVIAKYNMTTFILSPDEQGFLCQALAADPSFQLVAVDEHHVLFRSLD